MSSITTRPATAADGPVIARIHYEALDTYNDFYAAFLHTHPRDMIPQLTKAALEKPENIFVVAEDAASGDVVGFIRYLMEHPAEEAKTSDNTPAPAGPSLFGPKKHLEELWNKVNEREDEMDACYEKALGGKRHAYVKHIMVDPAQQRRGIGGQLLRQVTARADAEQIPAFIVASAEAYSLYARFGFEDLGKWTIDNEGLSKEVVDLERGLGMTGNEGLEERFRGVRELEVSMARWPK